MEAYQIKFYLVVFVFCAVLILNRIFQSERIIANNSINSSNSSNCEYLNFVAQRRGQRLIAISHHPSACSQKSSSSSDAPNVVHFVNFGRRNFTLLQLCSFLGAHAFIRPDYVILHGDTVPYGPYWEVATRLISNMYFARHKRIMKVFGHKLAFLEHATDVMRIKTLLEFGGIYIDDDVLPLKSFDNFRKRNCVMGRENKEALNSGILICKPRQEFMQRWLDSYKTYQSEWAYNAVKVPHIIKTKHPNLVQVEERSIAYPRFKQRDLLFGNKSIDLTGIHALHVFKRDHKHRVPKELHEVRKFSHTLSKAMRLILSANNVTF